MKNILLINVFGEDRPGVTSAITEVLSRYDISLLDIGQAVIHDQLSLAILAAVPSQVNIDLVTDEVKSCLLIMDIRVKFLPISNQAYQNWVEQQGKPRHMVTLLARKIDAIHLALVTTLCANTGLNIDKIVRLSGRMQLDDSDKLGRACVEFSVRGEAQDPRAFRNSLLELASQHNIDIAYQEDNIYRRSRQLVVFDMDSTLIDAEVIDELAKEAGVGDQVAAITEAAMQGKLDFKQSFRQRLELLEGLSVDVLQKVAQRLQLNEGAEHLIKTLKQLGYKTAIVSGGFTYFAEHLQSILGVDYIYANELDTENGLVTGKVVGDVIDGQRKADLLRELAQREGLALEQVIAVGDGANDLPMLNIAGLGIAYQAKPLVKASAKQSISNLGLDGILYLLGYSDKDIQALG
ncbi:phosphoserine phosphatase SerB [SAR92 clade bacterium H231]|nr:phosphoserine phosphatase SerB [Porticoccaceae bacterium]MCT2532479.1 phosphoserine phosphatase SerB [SAR92 clade bacterium H231]MBT6319454.1 phosphoserine phosphatase SerB [Porticoccaceae bacterium]MBT7258413.1 phosphoserine phosphatase SerB [Porticoccaceae bacterium]MBT7905344.1 phosphoserine phosphatase SerB [Porticoccaceae bacterium]